LARKKKKAMQTAGLTEMLESECPACGDAVSVFAKACPHCGVPNRGWLLGPAVVGALALLVVCMVAALVMALGSRSVPSGTPEASAADRIEQTQTDDFAWLTTAMSACDRQARADVSTLYFLVLPLASLAQDDALWREKSILGIGNAILLRSDDALQGLRSGALRLYSGQYDFRVLDVGTNTIYKWKTATGVTKVSARDASAITQFMLQFQTPGASGQAQWGDPFKRQAGTCYWVNAIVSN
jgi:hypothetical protein